MINYSFTKSTSVIGLIDDRPEMLIRLESKLLQDGRKQAFISPNPDAAYDWVRDNELDLLACDLDLGEQNINGLEVLVECHKIDDQLPLVLFTKGDITDDMINDCNKFNIKFVDKAEGDDYISGTILNSLKANPLYRNEKLESIEQDLSVFIEENKSENSNYEKIIAEELMRELTILKNKGKIKKLHYLGIKDENLEDVIKSINSLDSKGKFWIKTYFNLKITINRLKDKRIKWF